MGGRQPSPSPSAWTHSMSDFLVDTKIRLGQCNRCDQWVYLAQSGGLRSAADVVPCDRNAYIAALSAGRRVFRLATVASRPSKLLATPLGGTGPSFDAGGAQTGVQSFLVEHGCGGHARNMITFREVETEGPAKTVCEQWRENGWTPPPGKCGRERTPSIRSCAECDRPPFDLAGSGLGAPESLPREPKPAHQPHRPPETDQHSGKRQAWPPSPTANAAKPGAAPDAPTAPAVTKPSAPTASATGAASAPTASTGVAPTPPPSASSSAPTAYGQARPPTSGTASSGWTGAVCGTCRCRIAVGDAMVGVQHGHLWVWAEHDEGGCP